MKNKNGISLITLIITIVVVIILAAVVILTLTRNNSANDAKVANLLQSKANIEAAINLKVTKEISKANNISVKEILTENSETEIINEDIEIITAEKNGQQINLYKLDINDADKKVGIKIDSISNWYMDEKGKIYLVYDYIENVPKYMLEGNKIKDIVEPFVIILNSDIQEPTEPDEPVQPEEPEIVLITLTFDANGGILENNVIEQEANSELTLPIPTREGYIFDGWYTQTSGGVKVEYTTMPENSQTLYAQWIQIITLTLDANGGTLENNVIEQVANSALTLPTPIRSGYSFEGWYTSASGGTKVTYTTMPETSQTLYAHWAQFVTLTLNANGGSVTTSTIKQTPNSSVTLPTPTRSGYAFAGWYTATSGGTKVTYTTMPVASQTLYARWTSVWDGTKATGFARGDGTSSNPYIIETAGQLAYLQSQVNDSKVNYSGKYIKMVNDIDLNSKTWTSIGKGAANGTSVGSTYVFSGTFDGGNNSIYNLQVNSSLKYIGLFGRVDGTIKNLTISSGKISVASGNSAYCGAIVGYLDTGNTIENCNNKINIVGEGGKCAGIVGYTYGSGSISTTVTINNCTNSGNVSGYGKGTGGIVGFNPGKLVINNCSNSGIISSNNDDCAGGILGISSANDTTIYRCFNTGQIKGDQYIAGIAGSLYSTGTNSITECYNTGMITATTNYASGILGAAASTKTIISYCYNQGAVSISGTTTASYAAGIASNAGTIKNCYNSGKITCSKYAAGIASKYASNSGYTNNYYLSGSATYAIYNKASASGYMSKTSSELSASSMVTTLNNGSTVYKAVSGGYPVFTWQ